MQKDEVDYSIDIFYLPFISTFQTYMQKELKFIGIFNVTLKYNLKVTCIQDHSRLVEIMI